MGRRTRVRGFFRQGGGRPTGSRAVALVASVSAHLSSRLGMVLWLRCPNRESVSWGMTTPGRSLGSPAGVRFGARDVSEPDSGMSGCSSGYALHGLPPTDTRRVVDLASATRRSGTHAGWSKAKAPGNASHLPSPTAGHGGMTRRVVHGASCGRASRTRKPSRGYSANRSHLFVGQSARNVGQG